jgi:hypothetical protein
MMETESLTRFINENPNLFMNTELSDEDKAILKNIFIYKERLLTEIKDLEEELSEVQYEIEQIDISENEK